MKTLKTDSYCSGIIRSAALWTVSPSAHTYYARDNKNREPLPLIKGKVQKLRSLIKGTLDFDYMDHLSFPLLPHILDTKFKDSLATLEVKITDKSGKIRTITKTPFEKRLEDISTPDFNPLGRDIHIECSK